MLIISNKQRQVTTLVNDEVSTVHIVEDSVAITFSMPTEEMDVFFRAGADQTGKVLGKQRV